MKTNKFNLGLQFFTDGTVNTTSTIATEVHTFYDKRLITLASPLLVHGQFGTKYNIPTRGGQSVDIRIPQPLGVLTDPVPEGTNPAAQALTINHKTAALGIYAGVTSVSTFLEATAIDDLFKVAFDRLSAQAAETLDTLDRNVIVSGTNVAYAPKLNGSTETPVTHRYDLDATALMTARQIARAAAILESQDAPKIDGYYVGIIHPYVKYDLFNNAANNITDIVKYTTPERIFKGECGELSGVRLVVSTQAKVYKGANLDGDNANLAVAVALTEAASSVRVQGTHNSTDAAFAKLPGRKVLIGDAQYTVASVSASTAANGATITVAEEGGIAPVAISAPIYPGEAGAANAAVFANLFIGKDAYAVTDLEGEGAPFRMIVTPANAGGTENPAQMYGTIAWRAFHTACITVDEYLLRLECGSSFGDTVTKEN